MALKINPNLPFVRHYDKLIAVAVLILLLISLFYLTNAAGPAREREQEKYRQQLNHLKPSSANLAPMSMSEYVVASKQARSPMQLEMPEAQQAGFLTPERRVSCVIAACQKPIPYMAQVCPFCGGKQPTSEQPADLDSDGDGISDKVENALGLDPKDPADAKGDLDKDGFSNLDELTAGTDPKDPKSHPALVSLLRVKELRGKRIPLIFNGVNKMPDGMQLVFNQTAPVARTLWVRENEKIGDSGYVVGKVAIKSEERANPNMPGLKTRVDVSTVVVKRLSDNKEVTLQIHEGGKDTDVEAVIVLPLDNTEYTVLEKGTFKVRDETYRVVSVDAVKTSVVIENEASGQQKIVPKLD